MSEGSGPSLVFNLLALVLVGSALVGMRLPLGRAVKLVLAWIVIFGVVFTLFSFRSEFKMIGERLYASAFGEPVELAGGELRVELAEDGHYWVRGKVNGASTRFLVDSGASTTTLSADTARRAGIAPGGERRIVNTANGRIAVARSQAGRLEIGPIQRTDFAVDVTSRDTVDILGMNFLSSLNGWRVERNELILRP